MGINIMKIEKIKYLCVKSIESLKDEGISSFIDKTKNYIKLRTINKGKMASFKDILFINGCTLPAPERYRVDHQMEQLEASGLSVNKVFYENLNIDMMKYYRGFVFYRCPITPIIEEFINKAKENNKTVFYDIDDLVIDRKYTDTIPHIKTLTNDELDLYNNGVYRMGETLKKCDYAITTTPVLANELNKYVKETYINRNVVSEEMVKLSLKAIKENKKDEDKIIIGYLSGSITHNTDFALILPAIEKILKENSNVYLKICGILDLPETLLPYKERIITFPFVNWRQLPKLISTLDINLAPLKKTLFNEAKSENKWVEAALVKVVTVASNVGAFKDCITDEKNGILCNDDEWYDKLTMIIKDNNLRKKIAEDGHNYILKNYVTTYTGHGIAKFINSKLNKNIAFVLPTTNISGGVNVVIKHCNILKKNGYDVSIINMDDNGDNILNNDGEINVINSIKTDILGYFDTMVATLWATLKYVKKYPNCINKSYLVQNFETDFAEFGQSMKREANSTYESLTPVNYLTISKWCENWLIDKFEKTVKYAPNGIDLERFEFKKRNFENSKIKILIEGNSDDYYKNVDESFKIIDKLDKNKYEINFLSYQGEPKKWYYVDNFMHKVPHDKVGYIYKNCDILIKSSILESFSYPPLEMMATGGLVVVVPNEGNIEYLKDNYNCLFYEQGNIDDAVEKINRLSNNKKLREKLIENGYKTAKSREWKKIEKDILELYK